MNLFMAISFEIQPSLFPAVLSWHRGLAKCDQSWLVSRSVAMGSPFHLTICADNISPIYSMEIDEQKKLVTIQQLVARKPHWNNWLLKMWHEVYAREYKMLYLKA